MRAITTLEPKESDLNGILTELLAKQIVYGADYLYKKGFNAAIVHAINCVWDYKEGKGLFQSERIEGTEK